MTDDSRGDVVLVGLVFTDESGGKLRPAVLVSSLPEVRQVFESYFTVSAPSFTEAEDSLASALD